jgi:hypothetical protein
VCCEEGKLSSSTFPLSSLLKWIFFAARRHSSTPREERTTEHEREREREREDRFGGRKNQHFIQNPHINKKKKKQQFKDKKKNMENDENERVFVFSFWFCFFFLSDS